MCVNFLFLLSRRFSILTKTAMLGDHYDVMCSVLSIALQTLLNHICGVLIVSWLDCPLIIITSIIGIMQPKNWSWHATTTLLLISSAAASSHSVHESICNGSCQPECVCVRVPIWPLTLSLHHQYWVFVAIQLQLATATAWHRGCSPFVDCICPITRSIEQPTRWRRCR